MPSATSDREMQQVSSDNPRAKRGMTPVEVPQFWTATENDSLKDELTAVHCELILDVAVCMCVCMHVCVCVQPWWLSWVLPMWWSPRRDQSSDRWCLVKTFLAISQQRPGALHSLDTLVMVVMVMMMWYLLKHFTERKSYEWWWRRLLLILMTMFWEFAQFEPRVGPRHPSSPLSIYFVFSFFLLFSFFHWLYLFSSFVHPFSFYQNSPTPFPGRRS